MEGHIVWEYSISRKILNSRPRAVDIEWLPEEERFLIAVTEKGIFEVNRHGEIVWDHRTKKVSHDADRLPHGNTFFV
jgi:hypothetical protein